MATINGTAGNDVLTGTDGSDTIFGLAGDDVIDGILGADLLYGGSGNDLFKFSSVQVSSPAPTSVGLIDGGQGFDTIDWSGISPVTFGAIRNEAGEVVTGGYVGSQQYEIRGVERLLFNNNDNFISLLSSATGLEIHAGGGADYISTSAGNSIYGEAGDDRFFISGYSDGQTQGLLDGGSGNDTLATNIDFVVDLAAGTATSGNVSFRVSNFEGLELNTNGYSSTGLGDDKANIIRVSSSLDDGRAGVTIDGRGGDDYISGSAGSDILRGGSGIDTVSYEYSTASVGIDLGAGSSMSGTGRDTLSGFENVVGSAYADTIVGDAGRNSLNGGAGNDTIVTVSGLAAVKPDAGFDRVDGGVGIDTLVLGGVQSDYHVLNAGGTTFLVTARGATEVTGIEQGGFIKTPTQSWSNVLAGTAKFDGLSYIASYSDLRAVYGADATAGEQHFLRFGFAEGRAPSFNALDYIASYGDLRLAFGIDATAGVKHFIQDGARENRSISFSGWAYLASYNDLAQAYGPNETSAAQHFIRFGAGEGRSITFDAAAYAAANPDLAKAYGTDQEALARHYVLFGHAEGRTLNVGTSVPAMAHLETGHSDAAAPASTLAAAFVSDTPGHGNAILFTGEAWLGMSEVSHVAPDMHVIA